MEASQFSNGSRENKFYKKYFKLIVSFQYFRHLTILHSTPSSYLIIKDICLLFRISNYEQKKDKHALSYNTWWLLMSSEQLLYLFANYEF